MMKRSIRQHLVPVVFGFHSSMLWLASLHAQPFVILDDEAGGDCSAIDGTWNGATKTCKLTRDVTGPIYIDGNHVTLDGAGFTVTAPNATAVLVQRSVRQTTGVTIRNLRAESSTTGIHILEANGNTLEDNVCNQNGRGIRVQNSEDTVLDGNRCDLNGTLGVELTFAPRTTLKDGFANENQLAGIQVGGGSHDTVVSDYQCNSSKGLGIVIQQSFGVVAERNTCRAPNIGMQVISATNTEVRANALSSAGSRVGIGLEFVGGSGTIATLNTIADRSRGIRVRSESSANEVYNNNFLRNSIQAEVSSDSTGNLFNLAAPIGGNFWDTFDEPSEGCDDLDGDGFCDSSFLFSVGQDDLPWTVQDGWGVDGDPPFVTITSPADGAVVGTADVSVTAQITDASPTEVTSAPPGVTASLPAGGGVVSGDVSLVEGPNTLTVTATDTAGNVGGTSIEITSDTIAPGVTVVSPSEGAIVGASPVSVSVEVTDATATTLTVGSRSFQLDAGSNMVSADIDLVEGENAVVVSATDEAGNTTSLVRNIVLDSASPLLSIDEPAQGACFGPGEEAVVVTVTVNDTTETTVDSSPPGVSGLLPPGGGMLTGLVDLVEGSNTIEVTATDEAGCAASTAVTVVLDTTPPAVSIVCPPDGAPIRGTIDFDATAVDVAPGSGVARVDFFVDGLLVESLAAAPFAVPIDTTVHSDGIHTLAIEAVDGKGNAAGAAVEVLVDNTLPQVAVLAPSTGDVVAGTVAVEAAGSDAGSGIASITLRAGNDPLTTGSDGVFDPPVSSTTLSGTEDTTLRLDGPLTFTATVRDAAGNEAAAAAAVIVDNTAPDKVLLSPVDGAVVSGVIEILAEADDSNLESVELLVDGGSLGVSVVSPFSVLFDTNTRLDGAMKVEAIARDLAGNSTSCVALVTVDNVSVTLRPAVLNLRSRRQQGIVIARLEGSNLSLLLPTEDHRIELQVPGGNAVPALEGFGGDDTLTDDDGDGLNELTVAFDRATLAASIRAGIAADEIEPDSIVVLALTAEGTFEIGSDVVRIRGGGS